ncbi:uncharacterized protein [Nicotiana sylvestris]|uniref:uncharacterized protein n=1 Tax=Nicotiana sylvestris TaxID=4096 RepID=UPI00388CAC19
MPSYNLGMDLTLGTSQVTPSSQLLITGTDLSRVDRDTYFPGPSTVAEDRQTRDLHSGRRLSYGSSSQAHVERDADMTAIDDYIQEPNDIVVSTRLAAPFTDPVNTTDGHDAAHPAIRRRLDDDDPDSVPRRDGMHLRPVAALEHTGCGTHCFSFLVLSF